MIFFSRLFFLPFAAFFLLAVWVRNKCFDWGIRKSRRVRVPVISVGNLTFGGTGKTPMVAYLAEFLKKQGHAPVVLSRGYRGSYKGIRMVPRETAAANMATLYGDEPVLLAEKMNSIPVIVGRDRYSAAKVALESFAKTDVIVMDDTFQHRAMYRNLDLVLIDVSRPQTEFLPFPMGRAREGVSALRRAHAVLLTKINLVETEVVDRWRKRILERVGDRIPVVEFSFEINEVRSLRGDERRLIRSFSGCRVVLVTGLGNPEGFRKTFSLHSGAEIVRHFSYPDHHFFQEQDLKSILGYCHENGVRDIVISEKDAVKIRGLIDHRLGMVWVTQLAVRAKSEEVLRQLIEELF